MKKIHISRIAQIIFFAFIFSSLTHSIHAQNLDSLYAVWEDETQDDTSRTKAFNMYIEKGFLYTQPDSAFSLADQLIEFSIQRGQEKAQAKGLKIQGASSLLRGNYDEALTAFRNAFKIMEKLDEQFEMAACLNNLGITYKSKGNYPEALESYSQASKLFDKLDNQYGMAIALSNVGVIHQYQGNYSKALDYYEHSRVTYEKLNNNKGIIMTLNNVGLIYNSLGEWAKAREYFTRSLSIQKEIGDQKGIGLSLNNIGLTHEYLGEYQKALEYFEQSLATQEKIDDQKGIASSLGNIGSIYKKLERNKDALDYFKRALFILEKNSDQQGIVAVLNSIGSTLQSMGQSQKALRYCKRSLEISEEIGLLKEQKNACNCLYNIYKNIGDGKEALVYLEKANIIDDSLNTQETSKKLQQIEFEKKMLQDSIAKAEEARLIEVAHQEEVQQKNKTRNMLAGGGLILFMLVVGIYSRLRYTRKAKAIIEKEKDRSENLLLNILPADIAAELKEKGRADARDFDMVSIIFTDFKGFTAASEKLSAQDLVSEINTCFEAFDGIMSKYNIEKIKTIGDAYMAAGGLPVPNDESVKNTVLAAIEMQEFISKRKIELDSKGLPAFEMRVGVHTGPVVAGIVGVKKFQYDIWGDTVNTASRMESSGEVGKVNISQSTYELLTDTSKNSNQHNEFIFESRGMVEAKGKGKIAMYFVSIP